MKKIYPKVGLLNHVGGGNLGDDASVGVVMHRIRRRWPQAVIIGFSINPNDTKQRHGIPAYPIRTKIWNFGYRPTETDATFKTRLKALLGRHSLLFPVLRLVYALAFRAPRSFCRELYFLGVSLRVLRSLDLLIICGGGQLTEWGGPWAFPYTLLKWVLLARLAGVRCVFLNVGAGPLRHPLSKFFVTRALGAADYVSFRDNQSRTLAQKIGFTGNAHVFPDSVYGLELPACCIRPPAPRCRPIVGVAPMPYCDPRTDPAEKNQRLYCEYIGKFATFASWLTERSYSLALFGSDIGVDPLAIKDLQMVLRDHHDISTSKYRPVKSINELLSTVSSMDYVVTCRFHGVVFAHLLNKPVLAIAHHPKVTNLMNDLGLSRYCVDIRTFDANMLEETFASLVRNTEEVKSRMAATMASYKSQLVAQFEELFPRFGLR